MFPTAPSIFIVVSILAGIVISVVGISALMVVFAVTLAVTTAVAIHRSIPRKER